MCEYGYCRVSTNKQNIERQIRNIKATFPNAIIVTDTFTGTTTDRPNWNRLFHKVRVGDVIIFDSVSRMSRNADEGFDLYETLFNREVSLVFLKEAYINTDTYKKSLNVSLPETGTNVDILLDGVRKYLMALAKEQIKLAFEQAEKEVLDLHQRTKEGIETARLQGKQIGGVKGRNLTTKKSIMVKDVIQKHSKDFGGTLLDSEVIKLAGCSRNSYYKYKRELKKED